MTDPALRIGVIGASVFGLRCLRTLLDLDGVNVVGTVTGPKTFRISYAPQGVTNVLHADFAATADEHRIPCYTLREKMTEPALLEAVRAWQADGIVVAGWYHMVPRAIRDLCPVVGLHASLLPDYSGGAPLVWAMIHGEPEAGISLFELADGVDDGRILGQRRQPIRDDDTIATVLQRVTEDGLDLLREHIPRLHTSLALAIPQDESRRRIMPQRSPEDGRIDFTQPARKVYDFIRAQTRPYPGAFSTDWGGKVTIWSTGLPTVPPPACDVEPATILNRPDGPVVVCGDGQVLPLREVEEDGRSRNARDWLAERTSTTPGGEGKGNVPPA